MIETEFKPREWTDIHLMESTLVMCQSLIPLWYMFHLTTWAWDESKSAFFLMDHKVTKTEESVFFSFFLHSFEILVSRSNWDSSCCFLGLDSSQAVSGVFATVAPTVIPQGTLMGKYIFKKVWFSVLRMVKETHTTCPDNKVSVLSDWKVATYVSEK